MAVALYKSFHRRLKCNVIGLQDTIAEERELISNGEFYITFSSYTEQNKDTFITIEIALDDLCMDFIIDQDNYFFYNYDSTIHARVPLKSPSIRAFIENSDKSIEKIKIPNFLQIESHYQSTMMFQFSTNEISKYLQQDEIVFVFEVDIFVYHIVPDVNLQDLCYANLSLNLSKKNVFEILEYAKVYIMKDLFDQCFDLIVLNFDELSQTEEYEKLQENVRTRIKYQKYIKSIFNPELHETLRADDDEDEDEDEDAFSDTSEEY